MGRDLTNKVGCIKFTENVKLKKKGGGGGEQVEIRSWNKQQGYGKLGRETVALDHEFWEISMSSNFSGRGTSLSSACSCPLWLVPWGDFWCGEQPLLLHFQSGPGVWGSSVAKSWSGVWVESLGAAPVLLSWSNLRTGAAGEMSVTPQTRGLGLRRWWGWKKRGHIFPPVPTPQMKLNEPLYVCSFCWESGNSPSRNVLSVNGPCVNEVLLMAFCSCSMLQKVGELDLGGSQKGK